MIIVKKLLCALLCALLLCSAAMAEADETDKVDFNAADYTEDELADIMVAIQESGLQDGYLYSSDVLKVGEDIPAGSYEFWVEEDDIGFSQEFINDPYDYHCGGSTLCILMRGPEQDNYNDETEYEYFYYDEYSVHKLIALEDGDLIWTEESYAGANFTGIHMRYFPNRKSGLFFDAQ